MPLKTDKNFSETEAHTHRFCIQLIAPLEIHYLHIEDFFNFVNNTSQSHFKYKINWLLPKKMEINLNSAYETESTLYSKRKFQLEGSYFALVLKLKLGPNL